LIIPTLKAFQNTPRFCKDGFGFHIWKGVEGKGEDRNKELGKISLKTANNYANPNVPSIFPTNNLEYQNKGQQINKIPVMAQLFFV